MADWGEVNSFLDCLNEGVDVNDVVEALKAVNEMRIENVCYCFHRPLANYLPLRVYHVRCR